MCDVRCAMCDVKAHPACPLQRAGVLCFLFVLSLIVVFTSPAYAQAAEAEPDPHATLIERFRAAEDDEAIAAAWRAMQAAMTDAEIKAAVVGRSTDDGTLRADLTLLAPDLDLMPTGDEGPGDFQWVRLAAEMRRTFEAIPDHRRWDEESEHWHIGVVEELRDAWAGLAPKDGPNGMALHHLVAVASASGHPQLWNDGIPFHMHVWNSHTGISIVRRGIDTMSLPILSEFPPDEVSWADRGLVWLINALVTAEWFERGEGVRHTQAFGNMMLTAAGSEVERGWVGGFHIEPPAWDETMGRFAWEPIEAPIDEAGEADLVIPAIDWQQWIGTGICLVRVHRRAVWGWRDAEREAVDRLGIPTLVLIPKHLHVSGGPPREIGLRAYLLLPGIRPMAFGTFDLPGEEAE